MSQQSRTHCSPTERADTTSNRRHHVVYVTHNTEYHCRDRECVAVRDRCSGRWHRRHPALRAELLGGIEHGRHKLLRPRQGLRLIFTAREAVMTTPVLVAGRPPRESVFHYTSQCWAGEISRLKI